MDQSWRRFFNPFHYLRLLIKELVGVFCEFKPPQPPKPPEVKYEDLISERIRITKLKYLEAIQNNIHWSHEKQKFEKLLEQMALEREPAKIDRELLPKPMKTSPPVFHEKVDGMAIPLAVPGHMSPTTHHVVSTTVVGESRLARAAAFGRIRSQLQQEQPEY